MAVISIHDRYQFQMKLINDFMPGNTDTELELYLFLPKNLNVTQLTFTKDEFYENARNFIRLQTPSFSLDEVATSSGSIDAIEKGLKDYQNELSAENLHQYEYSLKMFGSIMRSSLRDYVVDFAVNSPERNHRLNEYCAQVHVISNRFRLIETKIPTSGSNPILVDFFRFTDEYLSLLIEHFTYRLLDRFKEAKTALDDETRKDLLHLVTDEIDHRKLKKYPSIPQENSDNEELVFRRSVLKKFIQSALYLDMNVNRDDGVLHQIIFALAAGVAMTLTLMVLFYYQVKYGAVSFPFFLAAAISYMFKDRIKEMCRLWLMESAGNWLFDHKTQILSHTGEKIGICRESFDFIRQDHVPAHVMQIRDAGHFTEIENEKRGEDVIRYRRRIRVNSDKIRHSYSASRLNGLVDMLRLNVGRFLVAMDEPEEPLNVTDGNDYHRIQGSRTYHVNLISCQSEKKQKRYRRFRIVLRRDGIRRIEEMPAERNAIDT